MHTTRITWGNEEIKASNFNLKLINVKIQADVIGIWLQGYIGVLLPGDADTKTRRLVVEFLREKHHVMRIPDLTELEYVRIYFQLIPD